MHIEAKHRTASVHTLRTHRQICAPPPHPTPHTNTITPTVARTYNTGTGSATALGSRPTLVYNGSGRCVLASSAGSVLSRAAAAAGAPAWPFPDDAWPFARARGLRGQLRDQWPSSPQVKQRPGICSRAGRAWRCVGAVVRAAAAQPTKPAEQLLASLCLWWGGRGRTTWLQENRGGDAGAGAKAAESFRGAMCRRLATVHV